MFVEYEPYAWGKLGKLFTWVLTQLVIRNIGKASR